MEGMEIRPNIVAGHRVGVTVVLLHIAVDYKCFVPEIEATGAGPAGEKDRQVNTVVVGMQKVWEEAVAVRDTGPAVDQSVGKMDEFDMVVAEMTSTGLGTVPTAAGF